ncbi:MAG: VCBS repeat-containing protein [Phycisphaerales bacterium]|nr:VCBS repeat-containing protein [Phycisphaerales bacterium]
MSRSPSLSRVRSLFAGWALLSCLPAVLAAPIVRPSTDAGSTYRGPAAGVDWARPVASGDLDGDGYDELIISASKSWGGFTSRVYVIRGGPDADRRGIVDLSGVAADQVIIGATVDDNLGASIATGDVNGDGVDDLLLCASNASSGALTNCGIAYLIYGGPDFFAQSTRPLSVASNWDLRIIGPESGADMGGSSLFGGLDAQAAAIGRLDADAYGDIALGAHLANGGGSDSGRAYIVFGGPFPSGFTLDLGSGGFPLVRIDGRATYDELGTVVRTGDITGDGIDELILGVQYASRGLFTSDGAVYIFRGRAAWPALWRLNQTPADMTLIGRRKNDELGASLAVADFTGDGIADLASAAPGAEMGTLNDQRGDGFIYGLVGSTSYQTGTYSIDYGVVTPNFLLIGDFQENLGMLVTAGDFNDDGIADIAAGEWFGEAASNGVVEVLYGRPFAPGATFNAGVNTDLRIVGAPNDRISFSLASADTNGDGRDEVVFGTPFNNGDRGTVYVMTHIQGDADLDGDLDLRDVAAFQPCFAGAGAPPPGAGCTQFDFNLNSFVDAPDLLKLEAWMTGPGV